MSLVDTVERLTLWMQILFCSPAKWAFHGKRFAARFSFHSTRRTEHNICACFMGSNSFSRRLIITMHARQGFSAWRKKDIWDTNMNAMSQRRVYVDKKESIHSGKSWLSWGRQFSSTGLRTHTKRDDWRQLCWSWIYISLAYKWGKRFQVWSCVM